MNTITPINQELLQCIEGFLIVMRFLLLIYYCTFHIEIWRVKFFLPALIQFISLVIYSSIHLFIQNFIESFHSLKLHS